MQLSFVVKHDSKYKYINNYVYIYIYIYIYIHISVMLGPRLWSKSSA